MAKFGEGDARWIVADRADGRNVNNWHWTEKDITTWCKERIVQLLGNLNFVDGNEGFYIQTTDAQLVSGDVILNFRKKKLIATYELEICVKWRGECRGGAEAVKAEGEVRAPYVSEENHDEDPELLVSTSATGPGVEALRQAVLRYGKKALLAGLHQLVKEIRAGGPEAAGCGVESENGTKMAAVSSGQGAAEEPLPGQTVPQSSSAQKPSATLKPAKPSSGAPKRSRTKLSMQQTFYARPQDLYDCFLDPRRVMAFTQSPATVEPVIGGNFSMFGGSVTGQFLDLTPGRHIVMSWRFNNWEEGVNSKVTIDLESPNDGTTLLKLRQVDIPEEDKYGNHEVLSTVEKGWETQIFHRIRAVFGYGL